MRCLYRDTKGNTDRWLAATVRRTTGSNTARTNEMTTQPQKGTAWIIDVDELGNKETI